MTFLARAGHLGVSRGSVSRGLGVPSAPPAAVVVTGGGGPSKFDRYIFTPEDRPREQPPVAPLPVAAQIRSTVAPQFELARAVAGAVVAAPVEPLPLATGTITTATLAQTDTASARAVATATITGAPSAQLCQLSAATHRPRQFQRGEVRSEALASRRTARNTARRR